MATLIADRITKQFPARSRGQEPVRALNDISIEIDGSQFVSIVGPSGCGKSTLLNIISGVDTPSAGHLSITENGKPARLGYVFQDPRLLPWRTIMDNMLYVHDDRGAQRRESVRRHLEMVKLDDVENLYPNQLSGGMQQRAGIARAFSVDPDLLLMDEPFSHLDAITARALRDQLQELLAQRPTTVLFVTHDVMEAVQLSDRIIVLAPGGVIHADITIDLPRPRRATDPAVATMQAGILERFEAM
ncbi:ABC transporter ATP-binding protein [Mycobacterium sp. NAZ190054]|uniref:ABC transporter ATP-binding protein n=1 Tax=Mycobacterium sp. NAZ190054 TaxID=1747766 RepID=UPI0007977FFE|nr:ABC transporter ATP-binding protein [Mycobacterium sp. NAZ190054]KWX67915.1 nitrate/sulfonate/bicarbonate ABC transporter ATP-binding protein [Mycobacterium sp. NAZ190054]